MTGSNAFIKDLLASVRQIRKQKWHLLEKQKPFLAMFCYMLEVEQQSKVTKESWAPSFLKLTFTARLYWPVSPIQMNGRSLITTARRKLHYYYGPPKGDRYRIPVISSC